MWRDTKTKLAAGVACLLILTSVHVYSAGIKHRGVYLTVSSYEGPRRKPGHFEVNWYGVRVDTLNRTFATIISEAPNSRNLKNAQLYPVKASTGRVMTHVKFPENITERAMTGDCLDIWAVLLQVEVTDNSSVVIESSCLRGHPRWMRQNCCHFSNLKLDELFIPGTHDSAMYSLKREWPLGDFLFTQDQTISHQLAFGVRSLDLRVGFLDGVFWIFHDKFKAQVTVETVLQQVKTFVETTGEVVILDFHRFTLGFDRYDDPVDQRHRMLVRLIVNILEAVVAHRLMFNSTLEDVLEGCGSRRDKWNKRPTVFVMYNYDYAGPHSEFLCPGVVQNWADAQDLSYLIEYLQENACKKFPGTLSSAQAELTVKFPSQVHSIRDLAEIVNFNVTSLFREHLWNCTNIVTNDYFLGSGIVELAIEANKYRGRVKGGLRRCKSSLRRRLSTNTL